MPEPIGVFRPVDRPVYDELLNGQIVEAKKARGDGDLAKLFNSGRHLEGGMTTWRSARSARKRISMALMSCEQCQQPLGFLSKPRASSHVEHSIIKDRVHMLAPRKAVTVDGATCVQDVLRLMVDHQSAVSSSFKTATWRVSLPERDALLRLKCRRGSHMQRPVRDFMTSSPDTIQSDAPIAFALHKMDIGGYRHIPVLTAGKVTGIISVRDILRYITEDADVADRIVALYRPCRPFNRGRSCWQMRRSRLASEATGWPRRVVTG